MDARDEGEVAVIVRHRTQGGSILSHENVAAAAVLGGRFREGRVVQSTGLVVRVHRSGRQELAVLCCRSLWAFAP